MSSVVVLVLCWNGERYMRPCLAALAAQDYEGTAAVLVVDNGSSDGSAALVEQEFPNVALLRNSSNLGFARGNNEGIRALLAGQAPAPIDFVPDIIVLLNQDTEVAPDWLTQLVQGLARQQRPGIAGCKIFFPDGTTLQHTGGEIIWPLATGLHRGTGQTDQGQYDSEEAVNYVTGAAMAVQRQVFEQVGLLDEGFSPAYFEDTDLCYRARAAGFAITYVPTARLRHDENSSLQAQSTRHQRAYHRSRIRFLLKHAPPEQLLEQFAPAEHEEIQRWSIGDSLARKGAYLDNLLELPAIIGQRADIADTAAACSHLVATLRQLHRAASEEEKQQRGQNIAALPTLSPPPVQPDEPAPAPEPEPAPAEENQPPESLEPAEDSHDAEPEPEVFTMPVPSVSEPVEPTVDVGAIMRQVRRQISERQGRQIDHELMTALDQANQQWNSVYEPLNLPPAASVQGWAWQKIRDRLHHEVRSYLDPMVYRQSDFNASVVRVLNNLMRRSNFAASTAEVESLHDELIQLREQVRQLQEQHRQP